MNDRIHVVERKSVPEGDRKRHRLRRLNESTRAKYDPHARPNASMPAWVCECANENCVEAVNLTVAEYDAVRTDPTHYLVAPCNEHVMSRLQRVVERHERYWVTATFERDTPE
jgi:hypothetical protein